MQATVVNIPSWVFYLLGVLDAVLYIWIWHLSCLVLRFLTVSVFVALHCVKQGYLWVGWG